MPGIGITGVRFGCGSSGVGSLTIGVFSDAGHTTPVSSGSYGDTIYLLVTGTGLTDATWYINECEVGTGTSYAYNIEWLGTITIDVVATNGSASATDTATFDVSEILSDTLILINEQSTYTLNGTDVSIAENLGSGVDATQINVSRQPLYVASGINGLPSVDYSGGSADHLFAAGTINAGFSTANVIKLSSTGNGSFYLIGATYNDGNTYAQICSINGGVFYFNDRQASNQLTIPITAVNGDEYLIQLVHRSTQIRIRINGFDVYVAKSTLSGANLTVGQFIGNGFYGNLNGLMGENVLINRIISDQEVLAQEKFLKEKWGLSY